MKKFSNVFILFLALSLLLGIFALSVSAATASEDEGYDDGYYDDYYADEYVPESTFTPEGGRAFTIVVAVIFGLLIPVVPLGYVVFMLLTKRKSVEGVDYIILGLSCLWITLGIGLLVILV